MTTTATRMLCLASLLTAACTIHVHLQLPEEELARLQTAATAKSDPPAPPALVEPARPAAHEHRVTERCPLDDAQAAYVDGDYVGALQQAVRSNHAGWRLIAATACALHDEAWVGRAVENLNPVERGWLRDVCRRQGLVLMNLESGHPRVVRTAAFDEDDED